MKLNREFHRLETVLAYQITRYCDFQKSTCIGFLISDSYFQIKNYKFLLCPKMVKNITQNGKSIQTDLGIFVSINSVMQQGYELHLFQSRSEYLNAYHSNSQQLQTVLWYQGKGKLIGKELSFAFSDQSIFFLVPGVPYQIELENELCKGYLIRLENNFLEQAEDLFLKVLFNEDPSPVIQIQKHWNEFELLFMMVELERKQPKADPTLLNYFRDIFLIYLQREVTYRFVNHDIKYRQIFIKFHQSVAEKYNIFQSIEDYSKHIGVSSKVLRTATKKICGLSPMKLHQEYVISIARKKLTHSNLSISEISTHLNYPHVGHFSRFFQKQTGETPSAYRKKQLVSP